MKVCRIIKADVLVKVGEVITASKKEHNYSEGRAKAESMLEDVRKQDYPELYGRGNSLFVFPYDDKKEERAFQWANTFASTPVSYCIVNLLVLEVDNVEWHDSRNYEDLCFLLGNYKVGMRDKKVNKDDLCNRYWLEKCNMEELSIEGLVNKARVISIEPYIVTHNGIRKLE